MSPSQPQRGDTFNAEVARIFRHIPPVRNDIAPQLHGDLGRATFSSSPAVEVNFSPVTVEVQVLDWQLDIRRTEHGVATFDSRLYISRIDPIINFESVRVRDCRFRLREASQWTIGRRLEGEGRLVRFRPGFQDLEIEVHHISILLPESPYGVVPLAEALGKALVEKPNKRAEALLLSVLNAKQKKQYEAKKLFCCLEKEKQRFWRFTFRYHYPVEYATPPNGFRGLCVDLDQETPTEDILLICYLEVKGGRGDALIRAATSSTERDTRFAYSYGHRPSAVVVDDVESDTEERERLFQAMIGATDREASAIDHARLNVEALREAQERLAMTIDGAAANVRRLVESLRGMRRE